MKKLLSDELASFKKVAEYVRANPDTVLDEVKRAKDVPGVSEAADKVFDSGVISLVRCKNGAVIFSTGRLTKTSSEHYIIWSPYEKPADYPNAFSAGQTDWYLDAGA